MRIGLDMAILAERRLIDRLILITRDTDMIPAMKHCRTQAIQIVLFVFRKKRGKFRAKCASIPTSCGKRTKIGGKASRPSARTAIKPPRKIGAMRGRESGG